MDFGFDKEQDLLRVTTRRFLDEHQSRAQVRRVLDAPEAFDADVWRQGAELGWAAMVVPEVYGGGSVTAQPLVDLVVLAEELGRQLNPGPFVPTNVVADALTRFGNDALATQYLPRLARGEITAAWCQSGDGSPAPEAVHVRAQRQPGGWRLDGISRYVQGAQHAAVLLVVANRTEDEVVNLVVPRPSAGLSDRVVSGLDPTRRFAEVRFDGVVVAEGDELTDARPASGEGGWSIVDRCLAVATVLQSAESVGAAEVLFEETVDYLKTRTQFGRTIASFQAIKHRLADMQIELEAMRVAAEYAALALDEQFDAAALAVATAGAYVDDAFAHLAGESLQLHGGIGFTWDHDVHLFVRRSKVNQVLYGNSAWHREQLVRLSEAHVPAGKGA
jgi:alkylation response protein AidB-like acyl-CoA dehydrogenase